jgi:hypothetical protein
MQSKKTQEQEKDWEESILIMCFFLNSLNCSFSFVTTW